MIFRTRLLISMLWQAIVNAWWNAWGDFWLDFGEMFLPPDETGLDENGYGFGFEPIGDA